MGKAKEMFERRKHRPLKGMDHHDFNHWFDGQSTKKLMFDFFAPFALPIAAYLLAHSITLTIISLIADFFILFLIEPAIIHLRWKKRISYREYQESRLERPQNVRKRRRSK